MLRKLLQFVLYNRQQAILAAVAFGMIPTLGWVGMAFMGMITLCKGEKEGAIVLAWLAFPDIFYALMGMPVLAAATDFFLGSVLVWVLAVCLRRTSSWLNVLRLASLLGIIAVALVHGYFNDPTQWWFSQFENSLKEFGEGLGIPLTLAQQRETYMLVAKVMTGSIAALLLLGDLFVLAVAREFQAILFNPGNLKRELLNLRLSYIEAVILLAVAAAAYGLKNPFLVDVLPVLLLPFFLAGMSLIHALLQTYTWRIFPLGMLYLLLVFFMQPVVFLVVVVAVIDSLVNFRKKINFSSR